MIVMPCADDLTGEAAFGGLERAHAQGDFAQRHAFLHGDGGRQQNVGDVVLTEQRRCKWLAGICFDGQ